MNAIRFDHGSFISSPGNKQTVLHKLKNNKGLEVDVTNYGARFVTIFFPDRNNKITDVVVGFDSIEGYLTSTETYYSALVGRYANRIARGNFTLNGKQYHLSINNSPNHLHGGPNGFHTQVWDVKSVSDNSISLSYLSPDGEENYPGNLQVNVTYSLSENNELVIEYEASTDQATVLNLTSHPFFNLNGQASGRIEDHSLQIQADQYTPVDASLIPTGIESVENTSFDFRAAKKIGRDINDQHVQLGYGSGYDHNFVLNGNGFRIVATAIGDQSGIAMDVLTDQPGMQLYTGNFMKGENKIKYGKLDHYREAFCLETQHFPDAPNQPLFPSTVLEPGQNFRSKTIYKFYIA